MSTERKGPPYDGKPCPCCPLEVRNLHAVAHNLVNAYDDPDTDPYKIALKVRELRRAVAMMQPLADAHFADSMHAHGTVPR